MPCVGELFIGYISVMTEKSSHISLPDDEVDLRELAVLLWSRKKMILGAGLTTMAVATAYAFFLAKPLFVSSALLIPTQTTNVSSELGAAAVLLGGKKSGSADVDLYQSLLTSRTVIHKLLRIPIQNLSDTGKGRVEPLFQVLSVDTAAPMQVEGTVAGLSKSVTVGSKESGAGGILEVKFSANSAWLAKAIGDHLLQIGQDELRLVRMERADVVLSRLSVAVNQAKGELDSASKVLAYFKDRNRSIVLPEQMLQVYRLEMEKSAKEQKYLLARKEYEMQLLEKAKAVPPMMILDPANLPARKSKPKRSLIMAIGLIAGIMGASVWVLGVKAFVRTTP